MIENGGTTSAEGDLSMKWLTGLAAGMALSAGTVYAADKWDMLTAYVDSN